MEREMERVDHALSQPLECDGQVVDAQLVYGLAEGQGAQARFGDLLQQAELAVDEAKRRKHAWAWHVPVDAQARAGQLSLLSSLRGAAVSGELEMWLQPKQCLRTGAVLGMEALVRWRHPQRGFVSPAEFIPFAERTGHIGVVTRAMLDAALRQLADWQQDHPAIRIAVNVSAHDVQDATFANRVAQLARMHNAPLQCLRLEITESSLMDDADGAMPVLVALRDMGIQLSIDDFGTGYSSLAYLKKLPVDELKIDRSFVAGADRDPDAQALLRTIIELGHSLNMQITAEGIEREQEYALLKSLGCDQAQGYLIARPMGLNDARAYVAALPA
jgi:EAL domain-containing protein (putative c-di-GMP-specific phosphodiesterase class I)